MKGATAAWPPAVDSSDPRFMQKGAGSAGFRGGGRRQAGIRKNGDE
jgi:hypothetical protein